MEKLKKTKLEIIAKQNISQTLKHTLMKQTIRLFVAAIVFVSFLQACKKSTTTTTTTINNLPISGTTDMLKTQIAIAFDSTGAVTDSLIINFAYDQQSRVSTITQTLWDNSASSTLTINSQAASSQQFSYSSGTITDVWYYGGSTTPSVQDIYYVNSASQEDSELIQSYASGAWQTTEKNAITYANGYASTKIATTYDPNADTATNINYSTFVWSGGDLLTQTDSSVSLLPILIPGFSSTTVTVTNNTYYPNSNSTTTAPPASYNFQGLTSSKDILKTETININGNPFFVSSDTYALDNSKRLNTVSVYLYGSSAPYTTDYFIYY